MISNETVGIVSVLIESIGILVAEKRSAMMLTLVAILTIIILFIV